VRSRSLLLSLLILPLAVAARGLGEETDSYPLTYHPTLERKSEYVVQIDGKVRVGDREPVRLLASYLLRVEILKDDAGNGTVSQRVMFGPGRMELGSRRHALRITGVDYAVDRDRTGKGTYVSRRIPALASANEYLAVAFHDIAFCPVFPTSAVAVEEEWKSEVDQEPVLFDDESSRQDERSYRGFYTMQLTAIRDIAGVRLADLSVRSETKSKSPSGEAEATNRLTLTVDAADGWLIQAEGCVEQLDLRPAQGPALHFENVNVSLRPYIPERDSKQEPEPPPK
jgi:hypothetical protein